MADARIRAFLNPDSDPTLYRGELLDTAAAAGDEVRAIVPGIAEDFTTAPMAFDERVDGHLPTAKDICLVAIDDHGEEWLLAYRQP